MSYRHLTMEKRNVIYRMRFQGYSDAEIARCLGCHRGTIGRECQRNANVDGRYEPGSVQKHYLIVRQEDMERARTANARIPGQGLTDLLLTHSGTYQGQLERPKLQVLVDQGLTERARRDSNPRPTD